ncbi:polyprenyl synthetase family protein [Conchiformibius kuhniae]|uniref:Polyprenyl synthetase family protein n=1 Tax=Conchiformibius kuhniae TaxID=211502 RepID=A0A8T9MV11_9NEIS|nr:farnesyl diphosphate synthase [Conchiformibius kuhniae]
MNTDTAFQQWQTQTRARTEELLERLLPAGNVCPEILHQAMRYSVLGGGKRLRPLLVAAAAELGNRDRQACEHAMAAVECVHVYSLVHDDMPAMDNDDLRRGKPTCHIRFGEAFALLAGDALQTLAFELLSLPNGLPAPRHLRMLQTLARATGSTGMAGGQAIDSANVGNTLDQHALARMHERKTGALIGASVALGALCCPELDDADLSRLNVFAAKTGLAFQVIDDVLDCEADTATLGKTAGKDSQQNKPTYVALLGLAPARRYAEQLLAEALSALAPYGGRADYLRGLAEFSVKRGY